MKVLHVLGSRGMGWSGGISATLRSLSETPIGAQAEFRSATLEEASAEVRRWSPDLLLWHGASSWRTLPQLVRLRRHCPAVVFEHHYCEGFERAQVRHRRRFRTLLRMSYGLMNRVVAVSEGQARWMLQAGLTGENKLRVIRSSRPVDAFLALPAGRPEGHPLRLAAYGRFTEQKGFATLIRAVDSLPQGSVELWLGGEGPLDAALRGLAAGRSFIRFLGRVDDVPALLGACDAVVLPSRWEPWGNVCLEARASALPVIATAVDGLPEQLEGCGFLVPPDSVEALAKAIARLLALTSTERRELGLQGRRAASGAWADYVAGWQSLLGEFR